MRAPPCPALNWTLRGGRDYRLPGTHREWHRSGWAVAAVLLFCTNTCEPLWSASHAVAEKAYHVLSLDSAPPPVSSHIPTFLPPCQQWPRSEGLCLLLLCKYNFSSKFICTCHPGHPISCVLWPRVISPLLTGTRDIPHIQIAIFCLFNSMQG